MYYDSELEGGLEYLCKKHSKEFDESLRQKSTISIENWPDSYNIIEPRIVSASEHGSDVVS